MKYTRIELFEGKAYIDAYIPDTAKNTYGMLVIPGGGYGCVCSDREGEPIALAYLARGFSAFVLHYSVGEDAKGHRPLVEASGAMAYIRENAKAFGIDPHKLFAVGFSAGGHLAASLATMWHREEVTKAAGIEYGSNRPDGVVLCYPVITGLEKAHKGSFYNIIGTKTPTEEQLKYYSAELCVDEKSSPAFIIHTAADQLVPVENSLYMAEAYAKYGITFELHVYPYGPHGMALANKITSMGAQNMESAQYERWVDDSIVFLKSIVKDN